MPQPRVYILREPRHAAELVTFLKAHAGPAANDGEPLRVTVARQKPKRSDRANAFMWAAVLEPIATQAQINGRHFSAETWHRYCKGRFLPEMSASGKAKWIALPDGELVLDMGTSDLNREEFALYLEQVQAYAATELGVVFDALENA